MVEDEHSAEEWILQSEYRLKYGVAMIDACLSEETTSTITYVKIHGADTIPNGRHPNWKCRSPEPWGTANLRHLLDFFAITAPFGISFLAELSLHLEPHVGNILVSSLQVYG